MSGSSAVFLPPLNSHGPRGLRNPVLCHRDRKIRNIFISLLANLPRLMVVHGFLHTIARRRGFAISMHFFLNEERNNKEDIRYRMIYERVEVNEWEDQLEGLLKDMLYDY